MTPVTITKQYRNMDSRWAHAADEVPCGYCILCRRRRSAAWAFRLGQEKKNSSAAHFITLTYAEQPKSFNGNNTLVKKDVQDFMKRLRKNNPISDSQKKLKYYACGEYGEQFGRPHYHFILFNLTGNTQIKIQKAWAKNQKSLGHISVDPADPPAVRYVTNYISKSLWTPMDELDDVQKEFSLMSKNLGISYLTPQMVHHHTTNLLGVITHKGGRLQGLPKYYKDKIFSKAEKGQIAAEMREIAEYQFEELFNSDHIKLVAWKKDQERKELKQQILTRLKF